LVGNARFGIVGVVSIVEGECESRGLERVVHTSTSDKISGTRAESRQAYSCLTGHPTDSRRHESCKQKKQKSALGNFK